MKKTEKDIKLDILNLEPEKRLFYLFYLKNIKNIVEVVNSVDDNIKINYLKDNFYDKSEYIIASLKNDNDKLQFLDNIKDDNKKLLILYSMKDGINYIEKIKDGNYKNILFYLNIRSYNKRNIISYNFDSNITFGVEVEASCNYYKDIILLEKLYLFDNQIWNIKKEITVEHGLEVTSPILYNCDSSFQNINVICDMLKNCNCGIISSCAGHIHLGRKYLDTALSIRNFVEIVFNCEKILFLITNEDNQLPFDSIKMSLLSKNIYYAIKNNDYNIIDENNPERLLLALKIIQGDRFKDINFKNVLNKEKDTIEFRFANGTLNPLIWSDNILLYSRIFMISKEIEVGNKYYYLKEQLKDERDETKKIEILLSLLNFNEDEKARYRERFCINYNLLKESSNKLNRFNYYRISFK